MRISEQPAFVLHRRQYSESSLLIEAWSRDHGRIGLIARGARGSRSALPALLQPFQELALDWSGQADLLRLLRAEALTPALALRADHALGGLYCNELLVRLLPRGDAHARLYARYAQTLDALARAEALAWTLRRFERDLLQELGYAGDFAIDSDGCALAVEGRYRFEPEQGLVRVAATQAGYSGGALCALANDAVPEPQQLRELRRLLRELIGMHLRGGPLQSWGLLAELGR